MRICPCPMTSVMPSGASTAAYLVRATWLATAKFTCCWCAVQEFGGWLTEYAQQKGIKMVEATGGWMAPYYVRGGGTVMTYLNAVEAVGRCPVVFRPPWGLDPAHYRMIVLMWVCLQRRPRVYGAV